MYIATLSTPGAEEDRAGSAQDAGTSGAGLGRGGKAFLTTSTKRQRIQESFELSTLSEVAMQEIQDKVTTRIRFNSVVKTGVPGFTIGSRDLGAQPGYLSQIGKVKQNTVP